MSELERLKEEKALIDRAQQALGSGDPAAALVVLGEHAQKFRNGQLTAERAGTRVLALCEQGKAEAARKEADRFLLRWPRHPMADRVAAACAP